MNRQWMQSLCVCVRTHILERTVSNQTPLRAYGGLSSVRPPMGGFLKPRPPLPTRSATPIAPTDRLRRDEEITARFITLVDEKGQVHERIRLADALRRFDRSSYFLIEVDPSAEPNPVCRMFDKKAIFEKQKASKKKKQTTPESVLKEVSFGWNVSLHDMDHKLGRASQFLEKGNKVKVEIVSKKGQQRLDPKEQQKVIDQVISHLSAFRVTKPAAFSNGACQIQFEK
ncbi:hypothetical protein J3Q64DRAFT_1706635 [Phycomyces blakesleeanus]|uniref:Translation initiation factor 3 N-terminal domain-containing protein n=2 Tax=Phycomyces blakesleeanus TaxID=4837 RepID=A0A163EB99_PHYB8|nr:hypothetical protein PHYBLDRAFT_164631 [Phycomyces blakesleeanus NRRL 1555(-)]OAD77740.1 hypothetical protein PHYBLDRAFT_164631 [Phycomyces blakesleeanus NRRL 1555(-)]|eukprot:XP_018295780.1 hypothetical protein PHYBLDRAFT_164631 [Phycomyces blakesleeanus NRRL 1555(-)]